MRDISCYILQSALNTMSTGHMLADLVAIIGGWSLYNTSIVLTNSVVVLQVLRILYSVK